MGSVDATKRDLILPFHTSILSNESSESGVDIEAATDRARLGEIPPLFDRVRRAFC